MATAAPVTPSAGNGPMPNNKNRIEDHIRDEPDDIGDKRVFAVPIAVRIPVMIAFKKENRIKPQVIFKYTCAL